MDDDIEAVVIDNGTWMVKAGYAGDKTARAYVRTMIGTTTHHDGADVQLFGDQIYSNKECTLTFPMDRGSVCNWDQMESLWEYIFTHEIRDGIEGRCVLITEVPGNNPSNRRKMVEILMEKFQVSALYITDPAGLALISLGRDTGVVLDVGGSVTHVAAINKGLYLHTSSQLSDAGEEVCHCKSDIGGNDVTYYLSKLVEQKLDRHFDLDKSGSKFNIEGLKHGLYGYTQEGNNSNDYIFDDVTKVTVDDVMKTCGDVLFHPDKIDSSALSIDKLLCNTIRSFEDDMKKKLLSNIILSGGATMTPGVVEKVKAKVMEVFKDYNDIIHVVAPPERQKSSWLGGSIIASLDKFPQICKSKEDYTEKGVDELLTFDGFENLLN